MGIGLATREWAKYNNEIAKTNILVNGITSGSDLDNVRVERWLLLITTVKILMKF
jgi:hypothetical protein